MKKNVSGQIVGAQMITAADGSAFTDPVTCYVTGDGGTQALGSVGSGACTHEGNGYHTYTPSQAETNYDHIAFTFIGTNASPATTQVYTTFPQTGDSYSRLGAAGAGLTAIPWNSSWDAEVQSECVDALTAFDAATATALATVDGIVDQILADTNELQTDWANGGRLDLLLDDSTNTSLFAKTTESTETFVQAIRLMRSALVGKLSQSGSTVNIRDAADSKNRISATVDSNGQRTAVTVDGA